MEQRQGAESGDEGEHRHLLWHDGAPLRNAFRQYLVPLLGDAMVGEVVEIYEFGPNPDVWNRIPKGQPNGRNWTAACWRSANARTRTWRSGTISMKSACVSPMRASNVRNPTTANHSSRCTSTRKITCGHRYATRVQCARRAAWVSVCPYSRISGVRVLPGLSGP